MAQHPNARPAPRGRETLVSRIESGLGVAEAARQMGVSRQTASKWLRRGRSGEGPADRGSRPLRPARTCARIVARRGMPRLADIDRVTGEVRRRGPDTPVRYERERPGELVHMDVKKVARIPDGGGRRARGEWESVLAHPGSGAARSCPHVAVDDRSRVAYAELLPDEKKGTCAAFMGRCLRFYARLCLAVEHVMTDSGPGYRSGEFNGLLASAGVRHMYTRPCSPWQNGKVERMSRTLAQEWQNGRAWESEARGRTPSLFVTILV